MSRSDTLDFEIFGGVAGEFEDFGGQILENRGDVYGSFEMLVGGGRRAGRWQHTFSANSHLILSVVFEETLDTATGELDWTHVSNNAAKIVNAMHREKSSRQDVEKLRPCRIS